MTVLISAAPVFGHPLIEAKIQLKRIKAIEWYEQGPGAVDREAWSLDPAAFEALLAALVPFRQVVILSATSATASPGRWPTGTGATAWTAGPGCWAGCRRWSGSRPCSAAGSSGCSAG